MKVRLDYVSNSSSSSFVIAYDEKFFGNLKDFISQNEIGYETYVYDVSDLVHDDQCDHNSQDDQQTDHHCKTSLIIRQISFFRHSSLPLNTQSDIAMNS